MFILSVIGSLLLIVILRWDTFETIVLPRRMSRRFRLAAMVYRITWIPGSSRAADRGPRQSRGLPPFYRPLSLLLLLSVWAYALILGFGVFRWALGSSLVAPKMVTLVS